jgi:hypothetical protein
MVESMLEHGWSVAIVLAGVVTVITALVQIGYAVLKGYVERMHFNRLKPWQQQAVHALAWIGHFARGAILSIVGISFIRAVVTKDATFVVNTDKAFDFIGDNIGHAAFIAVAVGTIFYGLFMFLFGAYYNTAKHN